MRLFQLKRSFRLLMAISVVLGLCAGVGAWVLKWMVRHLKHLCYTGVDAGGLNWQFLVWPLVGILLTSLAAKYLFRQKVNNACDRLAAQMKKGHFSLSPNIIWETLGGCALTVGTGASAGTESPIAYAGAAMGSAFGRMFRLPPKTMRILVACGAGAGIAGIFKAPVGAMFFVFEIMRIELSTVPVMALGFSCLTASLTAYVLSGCTPDITFPLIEQPAWQEYPLILLLGLLIGLYSMWYNMGGDATKALLARIRRPWVRHVLAGLTLGAAVMLMPGLYGDGYFVINGLLRGDSQVLLLHGLWDGGSFVALALTALGMIAIKGVLVSAANNGGGVAGDFSPTLYAGCVAGWLAAMAVNMLPGLQADPALYICVAMAAAMSAILQAPLMGIFITIEATQAYSLLLPVTICSVAAYALSRWLRNDKTGHIKGLKYHQI